MTAPMARAQLNRVPVGTYLYAPDNALERFPGSLTVTFTTPGERRLVIAYPRSNRKDRVSRDDTTEEERHAFKPVKASLRDNGQTAVFPHLAPDYYDLVVVDESRMTLYEGLELLKSFHPIASDADSLAEIENSLAVRTDRLAGGWEAFFDAKQFIRVETDGARAGTLLQQMRLGRALYESGAVIEGTIHSIDIAWVEKARGNAGWQVITRQQLYRNELATDHFFTHHFVPAFNGIRIGTRDNDLGPVTLPE